MTTPTAAEITVRTKSNCRGAPAILTHAQRQAYTVKTYTEGSDPFDPKCYTEPVTICDKFNLLRKVAACIMEQRPLYLYGISTVTLKNLCKELVGDCHSPLSNVSLPYTLYIRSLPKSGSQVIIGNPLRNSIFALN